MGRQMIVGLPLKGKIASISTVAKGAYLIYEGKLAKAGKIAMVSTMRPRRDSFPGLIVPDPQCED